MPDWEPFLCPYLDPGLVDSYGPQNLMPSNYGIPDYLKLSTGPMYTLNILMSEGGKAAEIMAGIEACTAGMRV